MQFIFLTCFHNLEVSEESIKLYSQNIIVEKNSRMVCIYEKKAVILCVFL